MCRAVQCPNISRAAPYIIMFDAAVRVSGYDVGDVQGLTGAFHICRLNERWVRGPNWVQLRWSGVLFMLA